MKKTKQNWGGKRLNSGRKKMNPEKKQLKSISVLQSDYKTFLKLSKDYKISMNTLFMIFLSEFKDDLIKKLTDY
jgi:hypothetical protein